MTIFIVLADAPTNATLKTKLKAAFPESHFEVAPGQFVVVAASLTAQEVAAKIGNDGTSGRVAVFATNGYWGHHRNDLWEWLRAKASG